jgi:hypothetical protein
MADIRNNQYSLKRYTRLVLVLFVLSVINMSMQIPAHAAMQVDMPVMDMTNAVIEHSNMTNVDMQNCECPPAVCDTVDAQQNQLNLSSSSAILIDLITFYPVLVQVQKDQLHLSSGQRYQYFDWQYRKIIRSPLSFSSILHI